MSIGDSGLITSRLLRLIRAALIVYLVVCLVFSLIQESFIFPGAASQGQKYAIVRPASNEELVHLTTAAGVPIAALFGKAQTPEGHELPDAHTRPTLLFFYGNGMCMADCAGEFRKFRRLGLNVMIPDYAGYGMSGGKPSETSIYETAEAAYQHLQSRLDIDGKKIVPTGWSLGASAAIELASKHPVPALITMSAFTSLRDMARVVLPSFPASLMLKHHFENEQKIRNIDCPILIIHGRRDQIIPYSMSERLEHSAKGKVTRLAIDDADHNDLFEIGGDELFGAIGEFLSR